MEQEDERARIARDLHDELGQQLTVLRLVLEKLHRDCPVTVQPGVEHALQITRHFDTQLGFLARELRPALLDDVGLSVAIREFVERWANYSGVELTLQAAEIAAAALPRDVALAVYRITQEALHNVLKHAQATHVEVRIEICDRCLELTVQDDGVGFNACTFADSTHGMGLSGMRERAALVGGTLQVESARGRGTAVSLRISDVAAD